MSLLQGALPHGGLSHPKRDASLRGLNPVYVALKSLLKLHKASVKSFVQAFHQTRSRGRVDFDKVTHVNLLLQRVVGLQGQPPGIVVSLGIFFEP